jgi:hypothetical protein
MNAYRRDHPAFLDVQPTYVGLNGERIVGLWLSRIGIRVSFFLGYQVFNVFAPQPHVQDILPLQDSGL